MDAVASIRKDFVWSFLAIAAIGFLVNILFQGVVDLYLGVALYVGCCYGGSLLVTAYRHVARRDERLTGAQIWALSVKVSWYGCFPIAGPVFWAIFQREDPWDFKDPQVVLVLAALLVLYGAAVIFLRLSFPLCVRFISKFV